MKCTTPCIYYREIVDKSKIPSVRTVCDARDKEIKHISKKDIENCSLYKTYKSIKYGI